ncbi:MAG: hypothetical protein WCA07_01860 [Gloeobacterales cyanobacterium]
MGNRILDPRNIQTYRYRVRLLGRELLDEEDQIKRTTIALLLADTAATLAKLEVQETQKLREESSPPEGKNHMHLLGGTYMTTEK